MCWGLLFSAQLTFSRKEIKSDINVVQIDNKRREMRRKCLESISTQRVKRIKQTEKRETEGLRQGPVKEERWPSVTPIMESELLL